VPAKFAAFGDAATYFVFPGTVSTVSNILALDADEGPVDFVANIGDLAYAEGSVLLWSFWAGLFWPLTSRLPFQVTVGNHEVNVDHCASNNSIARMADWPGPTANNSYGDDCGGEAGVATFVRYSGPASGLGVFWYSFDVGSVHFVLWSSEHDYSAGSAQAAWLRADLLGVDRAVARAPGVEEIHRLRRRFKITARLRLEAEVQIAAGARREFGDITPDRRDVGKNRSPARRIVGGPGFERARHGAHAARDARRHERGDQIKEQFRVGEPLGRGPVRRINLLLHARAVKAAVGKSVDRENVAVVTIEPRAKRSERGRLREFLGRARAEPQPDRVRPPGGDAATDDEGVALQRVKGLRPRFPAMDVGAVGEVEAVVEFHRVLKGSDKN
jgi:hypothetical protein